MLQEHSCSQRLGPREHRCTRQVITLRISLKISWALKRLSYHNNRRDSPWPNARGPKITFGLFVHPRGVPAVDYGGAGPTQSLSAQLREHIAKQKQAAEGRTRPIDDRQSSAPWLLEAHRRHRPIVKRPLLNTSCSTLSSDTFEPDHKSLMIYYH